MAKRYGDGSIYEDKGKGRWVGSIELGRTLDGRRVRKKVTAKTSGEVRLLLRDLARRRDEGTIVRSRAMTTGEWLEFWTTDVLPGTVAVSTEGQYRQVVKDWVLPYVGDVPLDKLQPEDVVAMMRALEKKGLSGTTQKKARTILRRSLTVAERFGRVTRNVAALTDAPKDGGSKLDDALDAEATAKVLAVAKGDRLEALAVLVLAIGLRKGEALDLRWSDLDLDRSAVTVMGTKSSSSVRTVALPPYVVATLRRHAARQVQQRVAAKVWGDADLVFTTTIGTKIHVRNATRWWHDLTVRAGVGRRRFHASRHTAATLMLNNDVPLEVVSATLGHAGLSITADVYAKPDAELQRKAADAMEKLFGAGIIR